MLEPLPVDEALEAIRDVLAGAQAVVVVADPGTGKTTRVPPALLGYGPAIVLQPRRAAARAIARRIAFERGWTLGREVGWHVRFERKFDRNTRLLLATEGVLTARLQQDPLLSDFNTIVLDEFHERSVHADVAIALARQAALARPDLRIVVMSATLDADRVSAFLGNCQVVRVPGRRHPVQIEHRADLTAPEAIVLSLAGSEGNVLCFQPGAQDIARTISDLRVRSLGVELLPLHGTLPTSEQDLALTPGPSRRVIIATNIAETSVTVPGVTAVVDTGFEKIARYDAELAIDSLVTERITRAAADQRAGRAGRIAPGVVYRLWNESDRLRAFREPEIHRVDLTGVVLDIAGWGGDPRTFEWFDAPSEKAVTTAIELLNKMQALRGLALTELGRRMLRLPLAPRLARMVVETDGHRDGIRAAALLSVRHRWPTPSASTTSDVLSALDKWDQAPEQVRAFATQLEQSIGWSKPPSGRAPLSDELLRRAILTGYPDRVAQRRSPNSERFLLSTGTGATLRPESGVRNARYVVALDVQAPRQGDVESRIALASAIEEEWLSQTSSEVVHAIDERGTVKARQLKRYDALTLAEVVVASDAEAAATLLADAWLSRSPNDADEQMLRRITFAGLHLKLADLIRAAAYGATSLSEISLVRALPHSVLATLERSAPEFMVVPSGRSMRLAYESDGTVRASVKLQELFGLAETPRVGLKQHPVLLSLLAPNGRPVQVTMDLRSFWDHTYPEVRKELRGRYPRHPWPENPWNAVPTHRAKPRS